MNNETKTTQIKKNNSNPERFLDLPITGDINLRDAAIMWNSPKESRRQLSNYAGQVTVTTVPQDESTNVKFLANSSGACYAAWRQEKNKDKLLTYLMNTMMELITFDEFHFDDVDKAFSVIPEYREFRDRNLSSMFS